ncbi:hypothetical protein KAV79_00800 [Candidatus Aerophobetes bacterium]|nr:hypothetical protein [Candidatus Aerophobetes bacterium]
MNYIQIIIAIVAIWGAGLSTYTAIRNSIKEKFRIKVELGSGFLTGDKIAFLKAANIGNRPVTLSSCEFSVKPTIKEYPGIEGKKIC